MDDVLLVFFLQSWNNVEMSPLEAGTFSVQITYMYKFKQGVFKSPHFWASIKLIIFNYYQQLLSNDRNQRNQSGLKILELQRPKLCEGHMF